MKIAVTSQNRRNVTDHAGRCRKFWIFTAQDGAIVDRQLLELPREQSFHDSAPHVPRPLVDISVLITGGMGDGLVRRLAKHGIEGLITNENDPEAAVTQFLGGTLAGQPPHPHSHGHDA